MSVRVGNALETLSFKNLFVLCMLKAKATQGLEPGLDRVLWPIVFTAAAHILKYVLGMFRFCCSR